MSLSLVLSLLIDTSRSNTLGLKVINKSNILSIRLGTDALFIRLRKKALSKTLEGTIARLFIIVGLIAGGIFIT